MMLCVQVEKTKAREAEERSGSGSQKKWESRKTGRSSRTEIEPRGSRTINADVMRKTERERQESENSKKKATDPRD